MRCYTEKAPNAWQRRGTKKTRNTYNQPNRPNQQTAQTKHQVPPKGQPGRRITPNNTAAVHASAQQQPTISTNTREGHHFVTVYRSNPLATYTETALRVSWLEVFKLDDNQKDVQGQCPFLPSKSSVLGLPGPEFSHEWDSPTCVIISRTDIFHVVAPLWLDSLYLRRRPAAYFPFSFIYNAGDAATLYATNITVQDNGPLNSTAVLCDDGAQALCAGAAPSYTGALVWLGHADTKSIGSRYPVDR